MDSVMYKLFFICLDDYVLETRQASIYLFHWKLTSDEWGAFPEIWRD